MKKNIFALVFLTSLSAFASPQETLDEGTSKYIVEAKSVIIEGSSAKELYEALNNANMEYSGRVVTKRKHNVTCVAEYLSARDEGEFIVSASCRIQLRDSTVINK